MKPMIAISLLAFAMIGCASTNKGVPFSKTETGSYVLGHGYTCGSLPSCSEGGLVHGGMAGELPRASLEEVLAKYPPEMHANIIKNSQEADERRARRAKEKAEREAAEKAKQQQNK
ncbi:hypothetical protein [Moraxella pluranimalium]|uniref:Lipoprotein n=1 Tax=Moraxella pluranimalium TaxID=470453 RepID=A0A1T0CV93_9GAMM|nr:hypothetical protein [Moraxella pluranimalium]OOS26274.1 hypothetical protein B0680_00360 [Moraxella pluranimalium]